MFLSIAISQIMPVNSALVEVMNAASPNKCLQCSVSKNQAT